MDCGKIKLNSFSEAFGKLWEPDPLIVVVGATRSLPFAKNLAVCIPFFVCLFCFTMYIFIIHNIIYIYLYTFKEKTVLRLI